MRSKLRLFVLSGIIATVVDFGLFGLFASRSVLGAELVALPLASAVSYILNRGLTFRDEPDARWVRQPGLFAAIAVAGGAFDIGILLILERLGLMIGIGKVIAVGVAAICRWTLYRWILSARVRSELAEQVSRPESDGDVRLSVIVPAYNEGERISENIAIIQAELEGTLDKNDFEVVVVDDGSSDNTAELASEAGARVLRQPNQGKGGAVRSGMVNSQGRVAVFTDADLAYPASLLIDILHKVESGWDVVVGSRRHQKTETVVQARRVRELGGRCINAFTHLVLLGHFRDTQCGIKGFRGDVARSIFQRTHINGFAFDVELFLIAEQDRMSLTEVPVVVENRAGSSVSLVRDTYKLVIDLFRIRRWAGEGRYQPDESQLLQDGPVRT